MTWTPPDPAKPWTPPDPIQGQDTASASPPGRRYPDMTPGPPQDHPPATPGPSMLESFGTGVTDVAVGVNQTLAHIPDPIGFIPGPQHELYQEGVKAYDEYVRQREAGIQKERGPNAGTDWARIGGNIAATAPLAAASPIASGALSAATTPVTGKDFWKEKGTQSLVGAILGKGSQVAGNVAGSAIAPVLRPAARTLADMGISMTPGQLAGGFGQRFENAMTSVPGLGYMIRSSEIRSFEDFNRAAFDRSLGYIGTRLPANLSGRSAIEYTEGAFRNEYNNIIPNMVGQLDPQLQRELLGVASLGQGLPPAQRGELMRVLQEDVVNEFSQGGGITGLRAQEIGTKLDNLRTAMSTSPNPDIQRLSRAITEIDASLDRMMERTNPGLYADKLRVDTGYANFKTVQKAAGMAGADGGAFTPAQLSFAVRSRDRSKDKAAFARGDALLQDLSDAAKEVLPQQVRDSGTTERAAAAIVAGGLVEYSRWNPKAAAGIAAASVPYTRVGQAAINAAVRPARPVRQAISGAARTAGQLGAPVAGQGARMILQDWDAPPTPGLQ